MFYLDVLANVFQRFPIMWCCFCSSLWFSALLVPLVCLPKDFQIFLWSALTEQKSSKIPSCLVGFFCVCVLCFFFPVEFSTFLTKATNNLVLKGCLMSWYKVVEERKVRRGRRNCTFQWWWVVAPHSVTPDFCVWASFTLGVCLQQQKHWCTLRRVTRTPTINTGSA